MYPCVCVCVHVLAYLSVYACVCLLHISAHARSLSVSLPPSLPNTHTHAPTHPPTHGHITQEKLLARNAELEQRLAEEESKGVVLRAALDEMSDYVERVAGARLADNRLTEHALLADNQLTHRRLADNQLTHGPPVR